jgi:hypothetical protein
MKKRSHPRICIYFFLALLALYSHLFHQLATESFALQSPPEKTSPTPPTRLSPAEQYSGELLAYLLRVVLGRAGQPKARDAWRNKAVHEPLDFEQIVKSMTDAEGNRLDFMVLDPDILDLSQVLFHYDERLSLYKGDYGVTSVYPAPEILALRLFLLKKMNAGEKINLDAFLMRDKNLLNPDYEPTQNDLAATRLSEKEMTFLRNVFLSEPAFYRYLTSPFLLKELEDTGLLVPGKFTEKMIQSAHYTTFERKSSKEPEQKRAVKIALLPSMTREFICGNHQPSLSQYGFKPTEFLESILHKLKTEILESTRNALLTMLSRPPYPKLTEAQWCKLWQEIRENDIIFCVENEKPLAIYPENASEVIGEICPEADFTVILMGKNIYRAIFFDPAKDVFPSVNRLYVDIMDIEYDQTGEEIQMIGRFICSRLKNRIKQMIERTTP